MSDLYGIPNCDTIKKARKWLDDHGVDYQFHDYKKEPPAIELLSEWADSVGWQLLLNRRGVTWRRLPDEAKEDIDRIKAIKLMRDHPSMIKRPVLVYDGLIEVGFSSGRYSELFS